MSDHRKPVGVRVTGHAISRFEERFPEHQGVTIATIFREVQQALVAGRRASKLPSWCERAGFPNGRHTTQRFVWNEDRSRCYPITRDRRVDHERDGEFGILWVVKTTLAAMTEEQVAEQRRLRKVNRENRGSSTGHRRRGGGAIFGRRTR